MKLLFKQRFFSWFDSYDIYNEAGQTVYTVKGQLAWGHCLKIYDAQGREIGTVKERILTFLPKFEMANENFSVYPDSVTSNISTHSKYTDEDYVSLRLDFKKAYLGGDVIDFSFKINQKDMLCKNETGYFYEFVPGWFNSIQVKQYEFLWLMDGSKDYVQRGSLDYGEYSKMTVQYGVNDFAGCQTVKNYLFDGSGAYNDLQEEKVGIIILCCLGAALLIIAEVYIVDSYVSYDRGRGFLTGHGYYIHTYGRSNPHYIRARDRCNATHSRSSGGRSGGGCACACACACAGGGRAGCSQKDSYGKTTRTSI